MTLREAQLIAANADDGLFPSDDPDIRRVVDEAHRIASRAAQGPQTRPNDRMRRALVEVLVGAGAALMGLTGLAALIGPSVAH